MLYIIMRMKAHEIGTEYAIKNLFFPFGGHQPEYFIGWKGNMQEIADGSIRDFAAQQFRQQHELVIVNPHHISWLIIFKNGVGKQPIDPFIGFEILRLIFYE